MDLFLIRHAWAGQHGDPAYPDDSLRPLTDDGRNRFARMAALLVKRGVRPHLIATSPLVRCRQTAEILAEAIGKKAKVVTCAELRPGGDPKHLMAWTEKHASDLEQVAWVGHAPDIGFLAASLIGQENGWLNMSKGAVAAVRFAAAAEFGGGELRWLVTAKILGC